MSVSYSLDEMTRYSNFNLIVEFYFDDSNLPYDKFMWGLHTANEEHWVSIATIATFKRMKPYSHLGIQWLIDALREKAEILEVDEKGEMCRRTSEPKEITQQDLLNRSVYAVSRLQILETKITFDLIFTERFWRRTSRITERARRIFFPVRKSQIFTYASSR
jgi:hypothetical protein